MTPKIPVFRTLMVLLASQLLHAWEPIIFASFAALYIIVCSAAG